MAYLFAFSHCSWGSRDKDIEVVCIPSSSRPHPSLVALHAMARSFTELSKPLHQDKAVTHEGVCGLHDLFFAHSSVMVNCKQCGSADRGWVLTCCDNLGSRMASAAIFQCWLLGTL